MLNTKSICDDITAVDKQSDPVVINFCISKFLELFPNMFKDFLLCIERLLRYDL